MERLRLAAVLFFSFPPTSIRILRIFTREKKYDG